MRKISQTRIRYFEKKTKFTTLPTWRWHIEAHKQYFAVRWSTIHLSLQGRIQGSPWERVTLHTVLLEFQKKKKTARNQEKFGPRGWGEGGFWVLFSIHFNSWDIWKMVNFSLHCIFLLNGIHETLNCYFWASNCDRLEKIPTKVRQVAAIEYWEKAVLPFYFEFIKSGFSQTGRNWQYWHERRYFMKKKKSSKKMLPPWVQCVLKLHKNPSRSPLDNLTA